MAKPSVKLTPSSAVALDGDFDLIDPFNELTALRPSLAATSFTDPLAIAVLKPLTKSLPAPLVLTLLSPDTPLLATVLPADRAPPCVARILRLNVVPALLPPPPSVVRPSMSLTDRDTALAVFELLLCVPPKPLSCADRKN